MPNQNDTPTVADLDLSGIPGAENLSTDGGSTEPVVAPDYSGVTDPAAGAAPVAPVAPAAPAEPAAPEPGRWDEFYKAIPEPLHQEVKPLIAEFDRKYEQLQSEAAPYQEYIRQGVTQGDLELALNLQNALLTDPKRFYEGLGETYGWSQQQIVAATQQQQAQNQQQAPAAGNGFAQMFEDPDNPLDPRVAQLLATQQEQLEQITQYQQQSYQQQQQEQVRNQGVQQMKQEFTELEQKFGQFDKKEVVKRAYANAAAGNNPSLTHAFHELKDYEEGLRKQFAQTRPAVPQVMGGANGLSQPAPQQPTTEDERRSAALQLALNLGATPPQRVF